MVGSQQLSNAMWEFLKVKYSYTNLPKWVTNLKKLTSLTLKENEGVETFLDMWMTQLDEVILFGVNLHDEVQVMLLLATLSSTWKPFITAQSTITYQTLDQLFSTIQQGKPMRIHQESTYHPSSITMATNLYTKHHKKPSHSYNHHHTSYHQKSHPSNKMYHQGLSHQSNNYKPCTKK